MPGWGSLPCVNLILGSLVDLLRTVAGAAQKFHDPFYVNKKVLQD